MEVSLVHGSVEMRCAKCGGLLQEDFDNGQLGCPACGAVVPLVKAGAILASAGAALASAMQAIMAEQKQYAATLGRGGDSGDLIAGAIPPLPEPVIRNGLGVKRERIQ